mmetsp:Transcript_23655/g.59661  ORF Transcript_23655/g.59661 Transcript_23655/m.59661 type:complete len:173 (-) Transcript_23655:8-526(-)
MASSRRALLSMLAALPAGRPAAAASAAQHLVAAAIASPLPCTGSLLAPAAQRWAASPVSGGTLLPIAARAAFSSGAPAQAAAAAEAGAEGEQVAGASGAGVPRRTTQLSLKPAKGRKQFRRMWLRGVRTKDTAAERKANQAAAHAVKVAKRVARWRKAAAMWRGTAAGAVAA